MASRKKEEAIVKLSIKNMPFASFFVKAIPARKEIKLPTIDEATKKTKKLAAKAVPVKKVAKKKAPAKKVAKKK